MLRKKLNLFSFGAIADTLIGSSKQNLIFSSTAFKYNKSKQSRSFPYLASALATTGLLLWMSNTQHSFQEGEANEKTQEAAIKLSEEVENTRSKENEEEDVDLADFGEKLKASNIKETLSKREQAVVIFFDSRIFPKGLIKPVTTTLNYMRNLLNVKIFFIDLKDDFQAFRDYLKERNMDLNVDEQIQTNNFMLTNKFDDFWFWEIQLAQNFYGDPAQQIINFYQGLREMRSENDLLVNLTPNDYHLIAFVNNVEESNKRLKAYRKLNTKNTDNFLKLKYWVLTNKDLAEKLGIDTANDGNVYLLRRTSSYNDLQANANIKGYDLNVEKLFSLEELQNDLMNKYASLMSKVFNNVIVVNDFLSFAKLSQRYKTDILLVYCDRNDPKFEEVYQTAVKARKRIVLELRPDKKDEEGKSTKKHGDVMFVISTTKNLMPYSTLHTDKPLVRFLKVEDPSTMLDVRKHHLSSLEKVDGMDAKEFFEKIDNMNLDELNPTESDNDFEANRKETMKLTMSPERFLFQKVHQLDKEITEDNLTEFVEKSLKEELPFYFDSVPIPKTHHAVKIVGSDFAKAIYETRKDCIVFFYHPNNEKNRGFDEAYEEFARQMKKEKKNVLVARYNAINHSKEFKPPKAPAVLLFKSSNKKSPITFELRPTLLKSVSKETAIQNLKDFYNNNTGNSKKEAPKKQQEKPLRVLD